MRAFARDVGVPAPQLSAILAGKKGLSKSKAVLVAKALRLSIKEAEQFVAAVTLRHGRSRLEKELALKRFQKIELELGKGFRTLQEARFQVVADWYHFAILHLMETEGFRWETEFIAKRLSITVPEVKKAVAALEQTKMIERTKDGYRRIEEFQQTEDVPSRAIRMHHLQLIQKAAAAVEDQTIEERDFASVVVAVDRTRLPELKERLREFREEFCVQANKGDLGDVYALNLHFFKITK